jgi:hypothetical protein
VESAVQFWEQRGEVGILPCAVASQRSGSAWRDETAAEHWAVEREGAQRCDPLRRVEPDRGADIEPAPEDQTVAGTRRGVRRTGYDHGK